MRLLDAQDRAVELGAEVGRGGEGVVCAVVGDAGLVAKIYATPPPPDRVSKLGAMADAYAATPSLGDWCAWPRSLLKDETGTCRGFLMARVEGFRPIHDLYDPEQRKASFPQATWDFLARTAANCARMFVSLHRYDVIVGDVNERNLLVGADATVRLVDCDSFQLSRGGELFRTGVGVVDYTPPELQGADFRAITHTRNHDRFGLAVIVFKLLFMGRHPFSGGATGDLALAIKRHQYDYASLSARLRHLVPLTSITSEVRALFDAAFRPESTAFEARPSADEWLRNLDAFEKRLLPCPQDPLHRRMEADAPCPWCEIEATLQYAYFALPHDEPLGPDWQPRLERLDELRESLAGIRSPLDPNDYSQPPSVAMALAAVGRLAELEPPPDAASWYVRAAGGGLAIAGGFTALGAPAVGLGMLAGGVGLWLAGTALRSRRQVPWGTRLAQVRKQAGLLGELQAEWLGQAYRCREVDRRLRGEFEHLASQFRDLSALRAVEIERLGRDTIHQDLRSFLHQFTVEAGAIPGLSAPKRQAMLIRGIVTAADVERPRLAGIPGLTPAAIDAVVAWRQSLEAQAGAARKQPVTQSHFAAVDANYLHLQQNLEDAMGRVLGELRSATATADQVLDDLYGRTETLAAQLRPLADDLWTASQGLPERNR
jgi:DNA-binding helix-hairpin-helix protein with protein kinase domain